MEAFIIFVGAIVIGMLLFIALTLNSISHDLFRIKQILDNLVDTVDLIIKMIMEGV